MTSPIAAEARSHTYVLSPDGTRFVPPAHLLIPIRFTPIASREHLCWRASKLDEADGCDLFDTQSVHPSEGPPSAVVCDVRHSSSVSVVAGDLSVTYRYDVVGHVAVVLHGFTSLTGDLSIRSNSARRSPPSSTP